ncbi:bifunctional 4-hydroxy-2-oxoglutarate aldolase/2-dehydro-3-deoxy-phosphogluconate aldolase [Conchiformibius steedae DSM 2580]|uniref:2-dehydro-3-deoxy-phosphogluconate aldolase n=1 Tax=Conchiformibius steedae DSM 2580 TaxID=1121352 RepID=A0AAE9HXN0_9NEIS|nr:bifunctional 4-hydroxy-2-oxoglutarate aldolase/2-dehydro-3-deoxy-phosphogluconate aldolase [Conchiformibius steedae]QMT33609.1 bifunctional 4-hydroxy-2-oxoglutarate aldolase/2-dehydro-3-deoxy-phosphogluconate aldolase [Conchiformibius steedae]URD68267.1 bifunctional 4-hydroxy-2-oxoglutarate aldolase/2-dehydro-3-deoxy-phosphogluconate aldolase [Conchiformibius steedae DSM 2580]
MNAREVLSLSPVMPVLAVEDADVAADLAQALYNGGIRTLEITLRTPCALAAISRIRQVLPDAVVGAGTVLDETQLRAAVDAGAQFVISPGIYPAFAEAAARAAVPVIPGVATAGELMLALAHGLDTCKLFPAEVVGGRALLQAWHGPFPQAMFCPTGGISAATAPDYLRLPNVLCVGGSWLAPKAAVAARDWETISRLAREAAALRA